MLTSCQMFGFLQNWKLQSQSGFELRDVFRTSLNRKDSTDIIEDLERRKLACLPISRQMLAIGSRMDLTTDARKSE
ncbi:hypothetical protein CQ011_16210 [Arthrobacter sp. MYb213]|nr:hypothetical protein CQ011_16210 [Arthrobacter sp. MYb213]